MCTHISLDPKCLSTSPCVILMGLSFHSSSSCWATLLLLLQLVLLLAAYAQWRASAGAGNPDVNAQRAGLGLQGRSELAQL